jgi:hypothetical protein
VTAFWEQLQSRWDLRDELLRGIIVAKSAFQENLSGLEAK